MQNMWISIALIVIVIIVGLIAGARLSTPGPQRRAVYASFATLGVLAIWFFIFISFFPADWIVPFFTVACIVVPICIYVGVARGAQKQKGKKPKSRSRKSFEIPRKVIETIDAKPQKESAPYPQASSAEKSAQPKTTATPTKTAEAPAAASAQPSAKPQAPQKAAPAQPQAKKPAESTAKQSEKPAKADTPAKPKLAPTTKATALAAAEAPIEKQPQQKQNAQKATSEKTERKAQKTAEKSPEESTQKDVASSTAETTHKDDTKQARTPIETPKDGTHAAKASEQSAATSSEERTPVAAEANVPTAAADIEILVDRAMEKDQAVLDELVKPFIPHETPTAPSASQSEKVERELNLGAPIASAPGHEEKTSEPKEASHAADLAPHAGVGVSATPISAVSRADLKDLPLSAPTAQPTLATSPSQKPAKKPIIAKPAPKKTFAELSNKAHNVRSQGQYAVAALLFQKAAESAPNSSTARDMYFEQLSCYVKADQIAQAKALAAKLRQSSVLTRFERIKLDAVERMS